jgi:nitrate reductase delta subunit
MRWGTAKLVYGCASVLLSYPEDDFAEDLAAVATVAGGIPQGRVRSRIEATRAWLAAMTTMEAASCYVDTFDLHRRRTLHLTYYRHGDTRERGMALTALVEAYREAGVCVVPGELPDFLPAMLELAAIAPAGAAVLAEHRAALEALRADLMEAKSPYAGVVEAAAAALGAASPADRQALRRYRAQGPPSERVGLEPFAPPEVIRLGVTRR